MTRTITYGDILKKRTVKQQIKLLGNLVKGIEALRSKLFIKVLPPLQHEGYARTIYCGDIVWVLVTEDTEFLEDVNWIEHDNNAELGDHVKFYDTENNLMLPVPDDYVVMFTQNPSYNTAQNSGIDEDSPEEEYPEYNSGISQ